MVVPCICKLILRSQSCATICKWLICCRLWAQEADPEPESEKSPDLLLRGNSDVKERLNETPQ